MDEQVMQGAYEKLMKWQESLYQQQQQALPPGDWFLRQVQNASCSTVRKCQDQFCSNVTTVRDANYPYCCHDCQDWNKQLYGK